MTWQQIGQTVVEHTFAAGLAIGGTLGFGGGAGFITWLHYMPAPYEDQVWYGSFFDMIQDRVKNMDRIGARRPRPNKLKEETASGG